MKLKPNRTEAILSVALLLLMGASSFYLFGESKAKAHADVDPNLGASLGKSKLDSLRVLPYGHVSAGCDTVNARFIRRWYVATDLRSQRKNVELLVSWPLTARHTISFNTVIGDSRYKAL